MDTERTNEFNIPAVAAQETLLRLSTLIFHGGAVTSIFGAAASTEKAEAAEQEARERHQAFIDMVMASPEEIAAFDLELTRLDEASTAALLESEEKLRAAEEELSSIRERGFDLAMPDGREAKVYRDGNDVREEDGKLVEFMTADDLPAGTPELAEVISALDRFDRLTLQNREITAYREEIEAGQERLHQGAMSQGELQDWKARLREVPEPVAAHLNDAPAEQNAQADVGMNTEEKSLTTSIRPSEKFSAAAIGLSADDFAALPDVEPPVSPPPPVASTPGPK